MVHLDPTGVHEQAGTRPCLVISVDLFNHGPAGLVVLLPMTLKAKGIPSHVGLHPPGGGVTQYSWIKCEDIRSASTERLMKRRGSVSGATIAAVEDRLRIMIGL